MNNALFDPIRILIIFTIGVWTCIVIFWTEDREWALACFFIWIIYIFLIILTGLI